MAGSMLVAKRKPAVRPNGMAPHSTRFGTSSQETAPDMARVHMRHHKIQYEFTQDNKRGYGLGYPAGLVVTVL